jgi:CheY-like chemotaxis protein
MNRKQATFLLVEDDDADAALIEQAFKDCGLHCPIRRAHDGEEALQILRGRNGHEPIAREFILLVDIRLPLMDGLALVRAVRKDSALKSAIIFMLTGSEDGVDKANAYDLNVAGYILKQRLAEDCELAMKWLSKYVNLVELPSISLQR